MMYCRNCGKEVTQAQEICLGCGARPSVGTSFCNGCGAETNAAAEVCVKCGIKLAKGKKMGASDKSRLVTTLLCGIPGLIFGIGGIHRLYLGKMGTGVTMLVLSILGWATCWLFVGIFFLVGVWIWSLVDFIFAVSGKMKDKSGNFITEWGS
jgi:TM2 domain-containing membrane protein YozV